jgi:hypothetical protein
MTRAQKLRWYADQLAKDATNEEQKGNKETAISKYLQASDLLLLLAKSEENYTAWKYYADKATYCQGKARGLIALTPRRESGP